MTNLLLLATEGAVEAAESEGGGLTLILPEAAELIYGLLAFIGVYLVLRRFAFPRLNTMLEERRSAIQGKMEEAEGMRAEAAQAKSEYEASIADAKGDANRIREEAKADAAKVREDLVGQAEEEAASVRERAQNEAALEKERTLQELRAEVSDLSVELASRIVEKEIDPATHRELVDSYINNLSSSN
jgi:F-type H+-transporting ATPase subunit b